MQTFIMTLVAVGIFFLSYSWFTFCGQKNTFSSFLQKINQPILPFIVLGATGCLCAYFLIPNQDDALFPSSIFSVSVVFLSGLLFWGISFKIQSNLVRSILILLLCFLNIYLMPQDFSITEGALSPLTEKILLGVIWALFAFCYPVLNGLDGILTIQSLSVNVGLMLLFAIGILPALYGYYGCVFIALFLSYNFFSRYPAILKLDTFSCQILGFLVGWLYILASIEGTGSCILILNMYYFYELVLAICKKFLLRTRLQHLSSNTFYNQLASAGIDPLSITQLIVRINLIMLVLAGFQIYSPNYYTIIVIAFFMIFWITSRVTTPEESNRHILLTGSLFSLLRKSKTKSNSPEKGQ